MKKPGLPKTENCVNQMEIIKMIGFGLTFNRVFVANLKALDKVPTFTSLTSIPSSSDRQLIRHLS